jgi:hypothetical protein
VNFGASRIIIENAANWDAALSGLPFHGSNRSVTSIIKAMSDMEPRFLIVDRAIANWDAALSSPFFRDSKGSVTSIIKAVSDIEPKRFIIDRATANARVIRRAPEALALTVIVAIVLSYLFFQHLHREHVAALNDSISSQEAMLNDYRTKLGGATPEKAATQIEKLTGLLAETQKSLNEARVNPAPVQNRSRDPQRLYQDNNPVAVTQDPKIDLERKRITFPVVKASITVGNNKVYEFQDWKLACGGTQVHNIVNDGAAREFSYAPLICKILGNR